MKYVIDVPEEMITSSGELMFHYKNTKDLTYQMYTGINVIPYTEPDKNVKNNNVHLCNSCVSNIPDNVAFCQKLEEDVLYGDSEGFDNICCCPCYIPKNYYNPESKDRKAVENEVWKFAKKVILGGNSGGLSVREIEDCFGSAAYSISVFQKYSYQEAKAKYEAWKKQNDEIHVGDEVEYKWCGEIIRFIVIGIIDDAAYGLRLLGDCNVVGDYCYIDDLKKTGRTFPEIDELLKKIKEN